MDKISPCLWFNDQAEEAINFYVSVFKNSKIKSITRIKEDDPGTTGKILTAIFELDGREFMAIDGGPQFPFTEAISLTVNCETQEEIDELWTKLTEGGEEVQCGWLKDKYGVSWQIVPTVLGELLTEADPEKANRVKEALFQMKKLDIETFKRAYEG